VGLIKCEERLRGFFREAVLLRGLCLFGRDLPVFCVWCARLQAGARYSAWEDTRL